MNFDIGVLICSDSSLMNFISSKDEDEDESYLVIKVI